MKVMVDVTQGWATGVDDSITFRYAEIENYFNDITTNAGIVVMGRRTYESFGHILGGRHNIIISTYLNPEDIVVPDDERTTFQIVRHIDDIIDMINNKEINSSRIIVIGGETIFKRLLPYCTLAYVIYEELVDPDSNRGFPNLDEKDNWHMVSNEPANTQNPVFFRIYTNSVVKPTIPRPDKSRKEDPFRLDKEYLHYETKQTNNEIPYYYNIGPDHYPEQNGEYVGMRIDIVFRDKSIVNDETMDEYEEHSLRSRTFVCARFDMEPPHRRIFISEDYEYIIQYKEGETMIDPVELFRNFPPVPYPLQSHEDIGKVGTIKYGYIYNNKILEEDDIPLKAVSIFSSTTEPTSDIILTYGTYTFKIFDGEEVWLELSGEEPPINNKDLYPNMWYRTKAIRKYYLEGRRPYGARADRNS